MMYSTGCGKNKTKQKPCLHNTKTIPLPGLDCLRKPDALSTHVFLADWVGITVGVPMSTTATDSEETDLLPVIPNYNLVSHVLHTLSPLQRQLSSGALLFQCSPLINMFPQIVSLYSKTLSANFSLTIC